MAAPAGTTTLTEVSDTADGLVVAPWKTTLVVSARFQPLTVMVVPTAPEPGSIPVAAGPPSALPHPAGADESRPVGAAVSSVLKICFSFSAASGENNPTSAETAAKPNTFSCAAVVWPATRPPRSTT